MNNTQRILRIASAALLVLTLSASAVEKKQALSLAQNQKTSYSIVLGAAPSETEKLAAKELALFLGQMTGATFSVVSDTTVEKAQEIVVGRTNRIALNAIPANLRPKTNDGFVIYPQKQRLIIQGNTPRGTLYGVYDFLDRELGCRFLTPKYSHIPKRSKLRLNLAARSFDPTLEYREILYADPTWMMRNRLNGSKELIAQNKELGGVSFIGATFVHTFQILVPAEKYFDEHPEYFALTGGKRLRMIGGTPGQLCLTNPDVLRISVAEVRQWIEDYKKSPAYDPTCILIASVSANDNDTVCECPRCQAVNDIEKARSGTLVRFVNAVAADVVKEYPNVRIETLAYSASATPPSLTKPHPKVIIRFAPIGSDFGVPYEKAGNVLNQPVRENFQKWSKMTNYVYLWNYHTNFHAYFKPFPDLRVLDANIRFFKGMKGYFAQESQTPGAAFQELRHYILARCMWRPETSGRAAMQEFCRLYYGDAADEMLRYIDMVHDHALSQGKPLKWSDASEADGGIAYNYDFLIKMDSLLANAEKLANTPEAKQHVAIARLSPWFMLLDKTFAGQVGNNVSLPLNWNFRTDAEDKGKTEEWQKKTFFEGWGQIRTDASWTTQGHNYHGVAWYATPIEVSAQDAGQFAAINFGAIDGRYEIYLDGQKIGERLTNPAETWNEPLRVQLPTKLSQGRHILTVRVWKENFAAGIWKPVSLYNAKNGLPAPVIEAATRFQPVATQTGVTYLSEFYGNPGAQLHSFYPRVQALLQ